MQVESSGTKKITTHDQWGDFTTEYIMLPKGLPGSKGAFLLKVTNLDYFMQMFNFYGEDRYARPYEILARLEKQVMDDVFEHVGIEYDYSASYKRDKHSDGDVIFSFSHFEDNSETEPDERYRSLYIYFEYTGSAS
ncbi:MAG: hypothetical protein ILA03_08290 [Bacteroidaceae bacterium]|nr:hypothetical protein [Bacteroidaceae bacterium]MBP3833944.1 hypothetical protein [Bacteroidaceae bacterium]